jgi:hypothetical protein
MIGCDEAKKLIHDLFEEEALVIGGLLALHDVDDDLVWRLVRNLDVIRAKVLRRLEAVDPGRGADPEAAPPRVRPHPAIEDFLLRLRRA